MEKEESCSSDENNCKILFEDVSEALQNCMKGKDPHEILRSFISLSGILIMKLDDEGCQKSTPLCQKNKYFQASRFLGDLKSELMELLHRNIEKGPEFTNLLINTQKMVYCLLAQLQYHPGDEESSDETTEDSSSETDEKMSIDKDEKLDSGVN